MVKIRNFCETWKKDFSHRDALFLPFNVREMCTVSPLPPPPLTQFWMKEYSNFVIILLFVIRIWASVFMTLSKTNLFAQYNWNQSVYRGYNGRVKPVKVVKKTYPVQQRVYRWKYKEVPRLGRPWSLNIVWKHWKVANIGIYRSCYVFPTSNFTCHWSIV